MFSSIAESVTDVNVLSLLSLGHSLGIEKLCQALEDVLISDKYLTKDSATRLLHVGIRFGRDKLKKAAQDLVIDNFEAIQAAQVPAPANPDGKKDPKPEELKPGFTLSTLPFDSFLAILQSDSLQVSQESLVFKAIEDYLALREPLRPLLEEEDPAHDPKVVA